MYNMLVILLLICGAGMALGDNESADISITQLIQASEIEILSSPPPSPITNNATMRELKRYTTPSIGDTKTTTTTTTTWTDTLLRQSSIHANQRKEHYVTKTSEQISTLLATTNIVTETILPFETSPTIVKSIKNAFELTTSTSISTDARFSRETFLLPDSSSSLVSSSSLLQTSSVDNNLTNTNKTNPISTGYSTQTRPTEAISDFKQSQASSIINKVSQQQQVVTTSSSNLLVQTVVEEGGVISDTALTERIAASTSKSIHSGNTAVSPSALLSDSNSSDVSVASTQEIDVSTGFLKEYEMVSSTEAVSVMKEPGAFSTSISEEEKIGSQNSTIAPSIGSPTSIVPSSSLNINLNGSLQQRSEHIQKMTSPVSTPTNSSVMSPFVVELTSSEETITHMSFDIMSTPQVILTTNRLEITDSLFMSQTILPPAITETSITLQTNDTFSSYILTTKSTTTINSQIITETLTSQLVNKPITSQLITNYTSSQGTKDIITTSFQQTRPKTPLTPLPSTWMETNVNTASGIYSTMLFYTSSSPSPYFSIGTTLSFVTTSPLVNTRPIRESYAMSDFVVQQSSGSEEIIAKTLTVVLPTTTNSTSQLSAPTEKIQVSKTSSISHQNQASSVVMTTPATSPEPTLPAAGTPLPTFEQSVQDTSIFLVLHLPYADDVWENITIFVVVNQLGNGSMGTWYKIFIAKENHDRYAALVMRPSQLRDDPRRRKKRSPNFLPVTLGIGKKCEEADQDICNGPLAPSTNYSIQLEIQLKNNTIVITPTSKQWITLKKQESIPPDNDRGSSIVIIVLTVLLVFFILLTVLITLVVCRRKKSRYIRGQQDKDMGVSLMSTTSTSYQKNGAGRLKKKFSGPDILMERRKSLKGMTRPVFIRDFGAWVERSSSDSDFRFAEEFESIRDVGKFERHEVADMPENRGKNRYVNVLAYDYTRVKLASIDDEPGSDYINANYVHGYKQPRAYIATQGPLPGTTDDFWRMVWEQETRTIVMVTQCNERGRVKCHQYWPTTEPTRHGEIKVTLKNETRNSEWTEREFVLSFEGETRQLRHFQYTAWPDHGVPRSSNEMLQFILTVRFHQRPDDGPLICHCSAGVGRTGTYLCVDILINKLQSESNVDVYGVVCLMRTQRCSMVQTEDQYIFIHRVILDYLKQRDEKQQIFSGYSTLEMKGKNKTIESTNMVEPAMEALLKDENSKKEDDEEEREKVDYDDKEEENDDDMETKSEDFLSEIDSELGSTGIYSQSDVST